MANLIQPKQIQLGSIDSLDDVDTTTVLPVLNDISEWDGSDWVPGTGGGGGGLTPGSHRNLDQLVHDIAETGFREALPAATGQPTSIIMWTSAAKTQKIRETLITYTSGLATSVVTTQYDGAGVAIVGETLTETPVYSGGLILNITPVLT